MKKIKIFTNQTDQSLFYRDQLIKKLKAVGHHIADQESDDFTYVITIGGDGTLLAAFHAFQDRIDDIQFIGIHTGHLGFYADWQRDELDELVQGLCLVNETDVVTYPLLEVNLTEKSGKSSRLLALNECSVRALSGTIISEVSIKGHFFETLRSDGICVATPTGSTGLNKSLGGAIMHPRLDAIQLTELAPLNNRVYRSLGSPIIISRKEWFTVKPYLSDSKEGFTLLYDNQKLEDLFIDHLILKIAPERIRFSNIRHTHFWDRVESSFIGRKGQERR